MDIGYLQLSTIVFAVFVGVCLFILSRFIRIPPIVLLLVGGVIFGSESLGLIHPESLGDGLRLIISLCVAIILFEGGLTLHSEGLKKAPKVIWRLLTLGVLITWLGTAILIHLLLDFSVTISLLAGSLIIVTGPTVIAPLLKRIQIKKKLYYILHWEGVLIDPIGVFIAILCFEWFSIEGNFITHIWQLSYRLLIGSVLGFTGGKIITLLLKKEIIHEDQANIFVFASALFLFGISDFIMHEAGLLTVVIAGLVIGIITVSGGYASSGLQLRLPPLACQTPWPDSACHAFQRACRARGSPPTSFTVSVLRDVYSYLSSRCVRLVSSAIFNDYNNYEIS